MTRLAEERCEACTPGTPALAADEQAALRAELEPGWEVVDGRTLRRTWRLSDFATAFGLVTRMALIAEAEGHHPDVCLGWGRVEVELTTHSIGGLSRNDFIVAARIDRITV